MHGTTRTSFHKHSHHAPERCKDVRPVAQDSRQSQEGDIKLPDSSLTPKYKTKQFPNYFCVSGDLLYCKFCQYNINRKSVDMYKDHLCKARTVMSNPNCVQLTSPGVAHWHLLPKSCAVETHMLYSPLCSFQSFLSMHQFGHLSSQSLVCQTFTRVRPLLLHQRLHFCQWQEGEQL